MKPIDVLIVDDMPATRRIVISLSKNFGFRTIDEAENGSDAWKMLQKNNYDLVLCDFNMPKMNGLELLKRIRADEELTNLPFIMVTAVDDKRQIVEIIQAKVSQYIVKPFNTDTLRDKIDKVLAQN